MPLVRIVRYSTSCVVCGAVGSKLRSTAKRPAEGGSVGGFSNRNTALTSRIDRALLLMRCFPLGECWRTVPPNRYRTKRISLQDAKFSTRLARNPDYAKCVPCKLVLPDSGAALRDGQEPRMGRGTGWLPANGAAALGQHTSSKPHSSAVLPRRAMQSGNPHMAPARSVRGGCGVGRHPLNTSAPRWRAQWRIAARQTRQLTITPFSTKRPERG